MKELISAGGAHLTVASLSLILLTVATIVGVVKNKAKAGALIGVVLSALVLGLWGLYNAIVRSTGLNSLWGLAGQMVLFVLIGTAIGVAVGKRERSGS